MIKNQHFNHTSTEAKGKFKSKKIKSSLYLKLEKECLYA